MSEKPIIDWEKIKGEYLGRVDGLTAYVCFGSTINDSFRGYKVNSDLGFTSITDHGSLVKTQARVEKYHHDAQAQKEKEGKSYPMPLRS